MSVVIPQQIVVSSSPTSFQRRDDSSKRTHADSLTKSSSTVQQPAAAVTAPPAPAVAPKSRVSSINVSDEQFHLSMISLLGCVLSQLVSFEEAQWPGGRGPISLFHTAYVPSIAIGAYLKRVALYTKVSTEVLIQSVLHVHQLMQRPQNPLIVNALNIHRLLLTSLMSTAKWFDDAHYNNSYFSYVGGVPLKELNALEVEFLSLLNFDFYVNTQTYQYFYQMVIESGIHQGGCACVSHLASVPKTLPTSEYVADTTPEPLMPLVSEECLSVVVMSKEKEDCMVDAAPASPAVAAAIVAAAAVSTTSTTTTRPSPPSARDSSSAASAASCSSSAASFCASAAPSASSLSSCLSSSLSSSSLSTAALAAQDYASLNEDMKMVALDSSSAAAATTAQEKTPRQHPVAAAAYAASVLRESCMSPHSASAYESSTIDSPLSSSGSFSSMSSLSSRLQSQHVTHEGSPSLSSCRGSVSYTTAPSTLHVGSGTPKASEYLSSTPKRGGLLNSGATPTQESLRAERIIKELSLTPVQNRARSTSMCVSMQH